MSVCHLAESTSLARNTQFQIPNLLCFELILKRCNALKTWGMTFIFIFYFTFCLIMLYFNFRMMELIDCKKRKKTNKNKKKNKRILRNLEIWKPACIMMLLNQYLFKNINSQTSFETFKMRRIM